MFGHRDEILNLGIALRRLVSQCHLDALQKRVLDLVQILLPK